MISRADLGPSKGAILNCEQLVCGKGLGEHVTPPSEGPSAKYTQHTAQTDATPSRVPAAFLSPHPFLQPHLNL